MMRKTVLVLMLVFVSLSVTASAGNWDDNKVKTITGTLTCLACDLKNQVGLNSQCEEYGHRHSLRKDNGEYLYFLENDHSEALIKGGGRHNTRVTVTGIYNKKSHTIDVQSYIIDGRKTEWCETHKTMDMCKFELAAKAEK